MNKLSSQQFDSIVKDNLIKNRYKESDFGFVIEDEYVSKTYHLYYTKEKYDNYINDMKKLYLNHYKK